MSTTNERIAEACGFQRPLTTLPGLWLSPHRFPLTGGCVPAFESSMDAMRSALLCQDETFQIRFDQSLHIRAAEKKQLISLLGPEEWAEVFLQTKEKWTTR